jgi:hypothetical protein
MRLRDAADPRCSCGYECDDRSAPAYGPLRCAIAACNRVSTDRGFCGPHAEWAYVTLADNRYRSEEPPGRVG